MSVKEEKMPVDDESFHMSFWQQETKIWREKFEILLSYWKKQVIENQKHCKHEYDKIYAEMLSCKKNYEDGVLVNLELTRQLEQTREQCKTYEQWFALIKNCAEHMNQKVHMQ